MDAEIEELNKKSLEHLVELEGVLAELKKVIVGQNDTLEKLLISLLADGHVLLEGVPGLAKTLMVRTLASTIDASFSRIQFTPDLLPADIMGTKIYNQKDSSFTTQKGPVFHNLILADEINRAPPKVQSALLEAMQERQVSIHGDTYFLERPFMVMATQNPIESEGTYRLPEAQVDRFAMKLLLGYPEKQEENLIIDRFTKGMNPQPEAVLNAERLISLQDFSRTIYADEKIGGYVASLVDATRYPEKYGLDLGGLIEFGASPRASIWLVLCGKAHALLKGRGYVMPEDIKAVSSEVLRHRIILTYEAEAEDVGTDKIIEKIISNVRPP